MSSLLRRFGVALALVLAVAQPAFAQSVAFDATRTLDNGTTGIGPVNVSEDNPLPVTVTGGGDATAANQDEQTDILGDILTSLNTEAEALPPAPVLTDTTYSKQRGNRSTAGETTLVAAVSGQVTTVYTYHCEGAGATNLEFRSGASGTLLTLWSPDDKFIIDKPERRTPYFQTAANTALIFYIDSAVATNCEVEYITAAP